MPPRIRIHVGRFHLTYMPRFRRRGGAAVVTGCRRATLDDGNFAIRGLGVVCWYRTVPAVGRGLSFKVVR